MPCRAPSRRPADPGPTRGHVAQHHDADGKREHQHRERPGDRAEPDARRQRQEPRGSRRGAPLRSAHQPASHSSDVRISEKKPARKRRLPGAAIQSAMASSATLPPATRRASANASPAVTPVSSSGISAGRWSQVPGTRAKANPGGYLGASPGVSRTWNCSKNAGMGGGDPDPSSRGEDAGLQQVGSLVMIDRNRLRPPHTSSVAATAIAPAIHGTIRCARARSSVVRGGERERER